VTDELLDVPLDKLSLCSKIAARLTQSAESEKNGMRLFFGENLMKML
jgi:hypothetical protein